MDGHGQSMEVGSDMEGMGFMSQLVSTLKEEGKKTLTKSAVKGVTSAADWATKKITGDSGKKKKKAAPAPAAAPAAPAPAPAPMPVAAKVGIGAGTIAIIAAIVIFIMMQKKKKAAASAPAAVPA